MFKKRGKKEQNFTFDNKKKKKQKTIIYKKIKSTM
jgi:hypothetical protein